MVVGLNDATHRLMNWFQMNNIPTDGLTVILNFKDADAAARFDWAFNAEVEHLGARWGHRSQPWVMTTSFQMTGLQMKVESPIHPVHAAA